MAFGKYAAISLFILALSLSTARAADRAEIVRRGKAATALVDVASREFGTAFCVDAAGYFITNAHVVERAGNGQTVSMVLEPGEATQRVVTARVVRTDAQLDLALLAVDKEKKLVALELGDSSRLVETEVVTAFGYPFGRLLAGATGGRPSEDRRGAAENPARCIAESRELRRPGR
jgi:serine protease Do